MGDRQPGAWEEIARLRRRIDEIDRRLLELLNARARLVVDVGRIKKEAGGMALYQPDRERAIFDALVSANPGPLSERAIRRLFECILEESRAVEREIMEPAATDSPGPEKGGES